MSSKGSEPTPLFPHLRLLNNPPFYQRLLISFQYAFLTRFGPFLSTSTPSSSQVLLKSVGKCVMEFHMILIFERFLNFNFWKDYILHSKIFKGYIWKVNPSHLWPLSSFQFFLKHPGRDQHTHVQWSPRPFPSHSVTYTSVSYSVHTPACGRRWSPLVYMEILSYYFYNCPFFHCMIILWFILIFHHGWIFRSFLAFSSDPQFCNRSCAPWFC